MKSVIGALILCAAATTAMSQQKELDAFGVEIGMIVGAESFCGTSYNHDSVKTFLHTDERANAPAFRSSYDMVSALYSTALEGADSEVAQTHGAEAAEKASASMYEGLTRSAERYGFIN